MTTGIFAGLWDVLSCTYKAKYICKHRAEGASFTTIAPTARPSKCASGWQASRSKEYCVKVQDKHRPSANQMWSDVKKTLLTSASVRIKEFGIILGQDL